MQILVIGSRGQLGQTLRGLVPTLFAPTEVVSFTFVDKDELDVTSEYHLRAYLSAHPKDIIINCAAYTAVDQAEDEPELADLLNHQAPKLLSELCQASDSLLIHISTDYVFSGEAFRPYQESSPTRPQSVYGRTKLLGEEAIRQSGCRAIILRTSWLYSPIGKNFFLTMQALTHQRSELRVVADQVGTPTLAGDLAWAILQIIRSGQTDKVGTYHYSNEGVCSWYDFAHAINAGLGHHCSIQPCRSEEYPTKALRPAYSVLDKSAFKETFGFSIRHWRDALAACIASVQEGKSFD